MKKRNALIAVSWALVAICMGVIFYLSSQNADDSAMLSDEVKNLFGLKWGIFIIRKCAHFLEFTGLAVLILNALYRTCGRTRPYLTFILTAAYAVRDEAYAVSDEMHQLFVEGRACRAFDVLVDSLGAAAGIIALYILMELYKFIKERRSHNSAAHSDKGGEQE
ncbi:vanZ family protein [Clostridium sp. CAG:413]|nr:vanZ family protein [Clostridium sp. CAG:413]